MPFDSGLALGVVIGTRARRSAVGQALAGRTRVNTFFAPPEDNPTTEGFRELLERAQVGIRPLQVGSRGTIQALRALRDGELLTMQPDVYDNFAGSAVVVPFRNGLTYAMIGTASLALRSHATLLPCHTVIEAGGRITIEVRPPLVPVCSDDAELDAYRLTGLIYAELERLIRSRPEQWVYWQILPDRMVPNVQLQQIARGDANAWRNSYSSYRSLAQEIVSELSDLRFTLPTLVPPI